MSYAQYLKKLLEPLGAYDLEATFNGGELTAVGQALDGIWSRLEDIQQEMCLVTAEGWGVQEMAGLLSACPVTSDGGELAAAVAVLLRIGGDSFTFSDMNDALSGCGINATVEELGEPGYVQVIFPDVAGIPQGYDTMKTIIDGILPAHVDVYYNFWYRTWAMVAQEEANWLSAMDGYTWYSLATGEREEI